MLDELEPLPQPDDAPQGPPRTGDPQGSPPNPRSNEAPDRDTPAWEGPEPDDATGLVDPRHEIPNPPGL